MEIKNLNVVNEKFGDVQKSYGKNFFATHTPMFPFQCKKKGCIPKKNGIRVLPFEYRNDYVSIYYILYNYFFLLTLSLSLSWSGSNGGGVFYK